MNEGRTETGRFGRGREGSEGKKEKDHEVQAVCEEGLIRARCRCSFSVCSDAENHCGAVDVIDRCR